MYTYIKQLNLCSKKRPTMKTFSNPKQENPFCSTKLRTRPMPPLEISRGSFENVRLAGRNVGASMVMGDGESPGSCSINIYINNDIQGINNSILIGSEVKIGDPGVSLCLEDLKMDRGFRLKKETDSASSLKICEKNAANRSKQKIGSMSFARKRNEIEIETKIPCSRANFYPIFHQKKNGTFVNDEARQKCEELRAQTQLNEEGDAYHHVFGEEHSGRVRGFGYGVCPSQIFGSARRSVGYSSSTCQYKAEYDAKMSEMEGRIEAYNTKVNKLETALAYVLEHVGDPLPPIFLLLVRRQM